MSEHELKTWPEFFEVVLSGEKPFEVRKDDRGFKPGDVLWLREWHPLRMEYTGRECRRTVTYTLTGGVFGIAPGFVVLGLDQSAAEARGFERAREQAARILDERCQSAMDAQWETRSPKVRASLARIAERLDYAADAIRAMTDERAEGGTTMCCRRCGEPIEKGPHGAWRHAAQTDDGHVAVPT